MNLTYVKALEKRSQWLESAKKEIYPFLPTRKRDQSDVLYKLCLEQAETFVMNNKFCDLVDHARESVPDDLEFEITWPPVQKGWMWLETPFTIPNWVLNEEYKKDMPAFVAETDGIVDTLKISAIGWMPATRIADTKEGNRYAEIALPNDPVDGYTFLCFFDMDTSFERWAYFTFIKGDKLKDKIKSFELLAQKDGGRYDPERLNKHEIRWIYTAFHLMAQKLAIHVEHEASREVRRRAEREKRTLVPKFKVVTLRRLELEREKSANPKAVDWEWQWVVRGHWRDHWFPSEKVHKKVFIEAFMKGPEGKPIKPLTQKIFVAKR